MTGSPDEGQTMLKAIGFYDLDNEALFSKLSHLSAMT
jgi:hypothetical protein